jgi:hypothetical protein
MKKKIWILVTVLLLVVALAGCNSSAPAASSAPASSQPDGQEPNVWVVTAEAPVTDEMGAAAGTAYPGFAVNIQSEKDGKATFAVAEMDDKGENMKNLKVFSMDTKYMEKQYVEPQAVILIISTDMIKVNPGGALYNEAGDKLITFDSGVGPFYFIQKSDQGYMFTLDSNVVFAPENDVTIIKIS